MKILKVFTAEWCSHCKEQQSIFTQTPPSIQVEYVNTDNNFDLCDDLHIEYLPTTILYEEGEELMRWEEVVTTQEIITFLESH